MENEQIMVSVRCPVYNQEKYIGACLDGFVKQITSFKFEVIVHDDASTDNTPSIIADYARKYPDIIKPIYETENQRRKKNGSLRRIMNQACTGKYIAMCDGDDYWTDPYKLQKQVVFLESHPDFTLCFHSASVLIENNSPKFIDCEHIEEREYFTRDIFPHWIIPTASVVCRRDVFMAPILHREMLLYGDIATFLQAAKLGRLWGMKEQMSVYRINAGGITQTGKKPDYRRWISHEKCLRMNFPDIDRNMINRNIAGYYYSLAKNEGNPLKAFVLYFNSFFNSPAFLFAKMADGIKRTIKRR